MKTAKKSVSKKKQVKQKNKFLHRIDINLSYLYYGEDEKYTKDDVLRWLRNDVHEGELDDEIDGREKVKISPVEDKSQIEDFSVDYPLYGQSNEGEILLHHAIDELNLTISVEEMIRRLRKLGYAIIYADDNEK